MSSASEYTFDFDLKLVDDCSIQKGSAFNGRMLKCVVYWGHLRCSFLSKKSVPTYVGPNMYIVETMQAHLLILLYILYAVIEIVAANQKRSLGEACFSCARGKTSKLGPQIKSCKCKGLETTCKRGFCRFLKRQHMVASQLLSFPKPYTGQKGKTEIGTV